MPLRSLGSPVFAWPNREEVDAALRAWAPRAAKERPELKRLGYFGSYARGDWGVGSDLDLIAVVSEAERPFAERAVSWDLTPLPVPAEILVYTEAEWGALLAEGGRFARTLAAETVWVISS